MFGALRPSRSPIVPVQKDIRASRPAPKTTLIGGSRFKPTDKAVIIEDVARDVDMIVRQVAFTGWSEKDDGDRRVRQELRKVLKRYGLPASGEPFDSAYGYIRENY